MLANLTPNYKFKTFLKLLHLICDSQLSRLVLQGMGDYSAFTLADLTILLTLV
jgi:hypothetical protein